MSAGLAVVATDYPGIREAVGTVGAPWLVRPRDPHDLAERILLAAANPEQRAELGRAGQERVRTQFSVAAMPGIFVRVFSISEMPATREPSARTRKSATRPATCSISGIVRPHSQEPTRAAAMC